MSRGHEIHVPGRSPISASPSSSYEREEVTQRGYLNRKCEGSMGRKTKVLHREKNWQLFWCNLRGTQLDVFKIDGLKLKPGEPPPKDSIPPTNLMKGAKMELMNIDGALVELDYVSQENKDIQKRRKFLFRIVSQNDVEYIMQAPNYNMRKTWVSALQAVAHNMPVEDDMMLGHAIKASRDSIKHNSKNMHGNKRSTVKARSVTAPALEDSDYVEFSTAEAMVAAGGDPRLQALRKRLQAKKELLKQLNRMYTSFLGGNAAAMYDETLILTQMEPPTFDSGSPLFGSEPPSLITRRQSKKNTYQVVHRKLTVSDSAVNKTRSFDLEGEVNGVSQEGVTGDGEDRRASTGDMNIPAAVLTSLSPLPLVKDDVLETELLMDYYLVPGAEWSLVRKGELVQIIGKARDTGWYRCMARRNSEVKLDSAPFSFLTNSLASSSSKSKRQSGITPEMIEEEYYRNESLSIDPLMETEDEGISSLTVSPPPSLMPKPPHTHPLINTCRQYSTEDLFPNDMEMAEDDLHPDIGRKLVDIMECDAEVSSRDSPDSDSLSASKLTNGGLTVDNQRFSSGPSPDFSEVSSVSQEDSKMSATVTESGSDAVTEAADAIAGDVIHPRIERRHSYQLATEDVEAELESCPPADTTKDQEMVTAKDKDAHSDAIKRSTSSVEGSSKAAINLRRSLESTTSPRAVSTCVYSGSLYQSALERMSSNAKDSAYFSPTPPANLDRLIDREVNTSSYPTPLIGCIPPSALKCFANKQKKDAHSHSDVSASESSGGSQSRPVSDTLETLSVPSEQTLGGDSAEEDKKEMTLQEEITSDRKYSNARLMELRDRSDSKRSMNLTMSVSVDDDSDGEADRRQALIFKKYVTVDPDEDVLLRRGHTRAKSLPPPVQLRVDIPPEDREAEDINVESSLDRKPSHLRRNEGGSISPDPSIHMLPPCQSVGSSPVHVGTTTNSQLKPGAPLSALFESPSRSGILKKLFTRKTKGPKLTTPEHAPTSGRISPGPPRGMLKQVLLGNKDPYLAEECSRARLSSISGRPVLQKGMGIVIGDESSSESEEEDEEEVEETSNASSLPVNSESYLFTGTGDQGSLASNRCSTPNSPTNLAADKEQLFLSLDQTKLDQAMRSRHARTPEPGLGRLKRSASDHDSLKLKAQDADQILHPGSTSSLKRNVHMNTSLISRQKPRAMATMR